MVSRGGGGSHTTLNAKGIRVLLKSRFSPELTLSSQAMATL